MANKMNFFVVSLIAMMAVAPAVADTPASQEWTKERYDSKISTINSRLATAVRDKIYVYDSNKSSPTYGQPLDPLNTQAETAFSGINEVLEMVDGNDGSANSAVELQTTSKNAFGAINELKGEIDNIDVPTKVSDLTNDSGFITDADLAEYATTQDMNSALAGKADASTTYTKTEVDTALSGKQATISNLATIEAGAALGATAVQPATLNDYVTDSALTTALAGKADASTTYTKTEVDTALSGKQGTLTFDATPTANSNNPVTSGGIYNAISAMSGDVASIGEQITDALSAYTTTADLEASYATKAELPTIDSALSTTSENPVQNKVVTGALNTKLTQTVGAAPATGQYVLGYVDGTQTYIKIVDANGD